MTLFPKFIKAAGVTFGHRQKSIVALARRGMLNEAMLEKVPFDYAKVGVDTGLNYAIKISAKGRKAIHDIGWVPKSVLETGYGEKLPLGSISKANVFYRGGRFDRFGLRIGLPEEGMFKGSERGLLHLSHRQALIAGGTAVGATAGAALLYSLRGGPDEQIMESEAKGGNRGIFDQLSKYHQSDIFGFSEKGLGPKQRKEATDFGSGWDPARRLAKLAGKGLGELFESKGFQTALGKGKKLKTLSGEQTGGALGVDLYETIYKGQKLKYVKKRIPFDPKTFKEPWEHAPTFKTVQAGAQGEIDIGKRFLKLSKEQDIAPSIYGFRKKGKYVSDIYQEYIPGVTARQLFKEYDILSATVPLAQLEKSGFDFLTKAASKSKLPIKSQEDVANLLQKLKSQMEYLHSKGITHTDLHASNLMLTSEGPGFAVIDWALANRFMKTGITGRKVVPDIGWARNIQTDLESLEQMGSHFQSRMGSEGAAIAGVLASKQGFLKDVVLPATRRNEGVFDKAYAKTARRENKLRDLEKLVSEGRTTKKRVIPTISTDTGAEISGLNVSKVSPKLSDWESPWQGPIVSGEISETMVKPSDLRDMNNIFGPKLGDIPIGVSSAASHYMNELNAPVGFQPGGFSDASREATVSDSQIASGYMAGGMAPTIIGITGTPSPNLPDLNDNLPEPMMAMAPEQLNSSQSKMYLQDNVPLSTKIQVKGRVNTNLNLNELSQAVSAKVPKSKVNIYVNDNRSKLTPQHISDMIEK